MATTPRDLGQLSLLPENDRVDSLARGQENQWFERVSSRTHPRELGNLLVGFANAEGGLILIGIHNRRIEGIRGTGTKLNDWQQAAMDFTEPSVRHRFELVPCTNSRGEEDDVAVLEIEASERVHTNVRGETYLRVGDENRKLGVVEAQELRYDKGDSVFDGTAAEGAAYDDLDSKLVERFLERTNAMSDAASVLPARGLAVRQGKRLVPTVAGVLVLGRDPERLYPQAELRLLQYRGSSRETGARSNVVRDRRIAGPLGNQVDVAHRLLRRWIPSALRLEAEGRFGPSTLIPEFAWLEAVVNALIHRSYSLGGDHIRVELFDDRVEVESPGRLPGLVRIENIRSTRFARNPRVARAMNDLEYGRELGEGVNRMFEEMERVGLPDPVYEQGPGSVKVALLADPLAGRILRDLPSGSERFVEFLTRTGRITTTQAVDLLGVSRPVALRHLHKLTEQGLIEHMGTSLKDPRGFWRLRRVRE